MYLLLYFLKFILSIFLEDHIGNKCAIVCFNVSILSKYYIYIYIYIYICIIMFYQINSLTHMKAFFSAWSMSKACDIGFMTSLHSAKKRVSAGFSRKHKCH